MIVDAHKMHIFLFFLIDFKICHFKCTALYCKLNAFKRSVKREDQMHLCTYIMCVLVV